MQSIASQYDLSEKFPARFWRDQSEWSRPFFENMPERYESAHIDIARRYDIQKANQWLCDYQPLVKSDISFLSSDSEFKDWAEAKATKCRGLVREFGIQRAWRLCAKVAQEYDIAPPVTQGRKGVCFPFQVDSLVERFKDEAWWLRQIRKVAVREVERVALALGKVSQRNQAYCSDWAVKKRQQQKARNRALLENLKAVNNEGDEYTLQELANLGVSNPVNRRHELMARLRGFEEVAKHYGHSATFITVTCPSRFHPSSKKYDGSSPRAAQAYLCATWARIRAKLDREGVRPYGFRIAEPHKDGCPHWHVLLFCNPDDVGFIQGVFKDHALRVDGKEAGALRNRVDFENINLNTGSAVGYIAKYICKNIDGKFNAEMDWFGEKYSGDVAFNAVDIDGNFCGRSDDAAARVEAWASAWGIRQFQQIGGPSVTVWRELRRMDTEEDEFDLFGGVVERARRAADSGDWAAFCIAMGAVDAPRKGHAISALIFLPHEIDKETGEVICSAFGVANKYGEPAAGQVLGVTALNVDYLTRFFTWDIERINRAEVIEIRGHRELMPDWVLRGAAPPSGAQRSALDLCK